LLNLQEVKVRPVLTTEEQKFQQLMAEHYYLGALPKIGETLWHVATWQNKWVAIMTLSAAAWKCAARDQWTGWDFRLISGNPQTTIHYWRPENHDQR
jgi:hypothetical protein